MDIADLENIIATAEKRMSETHDPSIALALELIARLSAHMALLREQAGLA